MVLALRMLKAYTTNELLADWVLDPVLVLKLSLDAWERLGRYILSAVEDRDLFVTRIERLQNDMMKIKGPSVAEQFAREL